MTNNMCFEHSSKLCDLHAYLCRRWGKQRMSRIAIVRSTRQVIHRWYWMPLLCSCQMLNQDHIRKWWPGTVWRLLVQKVRLQYLTEHTQNSPPVTRGHSGAKLMSLPSDQFCPTILQRKCFPSCFVLCEWNKVIREMSDSEWLPKNVLSRKFVLLGFGGWHHRWTKLTMKSYSKPRPLQFVPYVKQERAIGDCRPLLGLLCGVFCVANKWKDVLNERSQWSSCKCVNVKGLKSCKHHMV